MTRLQAIKAFFEADGGRTIERMELLKCSVDERKELGDMCAAALGVQLEEPAAIAA